MNGLFAGNITLTSTGLSVAWTPYNKPVAINKGSFNEYYYYGPDRGLYQRYTHETFSGCSPPPAESSRTLYLGDLFEVLTKSTSPGIVEYRHYIMVGGMRIAMHKEWSNGNRADEYLHHDHLGSVVMLTNSSGAVIERLSYDPWGKRRYTSSSQAWLAATPGLFITPISSALLTRGFTGHDHLDRLGLVNMGGRIYDPEIGRFLSADPFIQFPESTQGLDRYAYVNNNPLSYTDPSGYGILGLVGTILQFTPFQPLGLVLIAVDGYLETGTLRGAFFSTLAAAAAVAVGGAYANADWYLKAALHGLVQGAIAAVQGGRFGPTFLAAFAGSSLGPVKGSRSDLFGNAPGRVIQAAVVGGTASRIGGGKFANGAVTGAFVQAFNDEMHDEPEIRFEEGTENLEKAYRAHASRLSKLIDRLPDSVDSITFRLGDTGGDPMRIGQDVAVKDFLDSGLMVTGRITPQVSRGPHRTHGVLPPAA